MPEWFLGIFPRDATGLWVVSVAALTNVACALVGCYLVLRRMSLLGDALAHAVLPGLVLAFLFSHSFAVGPMLLGAVAVGLLTTFLTETFHRQGGVTADASMGVVFTSLFALGVLLWRVFASHIDLDASCVLEGQLDLVATDLQPLGGWEVPRQLFTIVPALAVNLLAIGLLWKELKISAFDPALATTMGISATAMHYLLMALVSLTAVASFEAVGSILVVAMLIAPPATAQLLSDRLSHMMGVAVGVALLTAVIGFRLASAWNVNTAGMMAVVAGGLYGLAVFFSPRYGIVSTLARNVQMSLRILCEDVLAMLYRVEELAAGRSLDADEARRAVGGGLLARWGLRRLIGRGDVTRRDDGLQLTDSGRRRAAALVRGHRLWEAYLVEYLGLPLDHVHDPAERMEHYLDEQMREELAESVTEAQRDPHGREIPGGGSEEG